MFVWLYRKGDNGAETNTKNVAIERDFYGKRGEPAVDDQITGVEGEHAQLLSELRAQTKSGPVPDPKKIPHLVAHLSTRTRFLRQSVTDSMEFLFSDLFDHLAKPETLEHLLSGRAVGNQLTNELIQRGLTAEQADALKVALQPNLPKLMRQAMPNIAEQVKGFAEFARTRYPQIARDAHIKALADHPDLPERVERYRAFSWFTLKSEIPLVLGDTMTAFETRGQRRFKPFDDADDIHRIFLPIASDRAIVGTPFRPPPTLEPRRLNKALVRCSYEFFVSSVELRSDSPLSSSIGKWSGILTEEELRAVGKNIWLGFE